MEQMTLDLGQVKEEIRQELKKAANSFIFIGYRLRQILDSGAYAQEGYEDIYAFAKKEFGMGQSAVSRFMAINEKYSAGGYGPTLLPEYESFGSSKLSEMLTLNAEDTKMITTDMTVAQIREVKDFVRGENAMEGQQVFTGGFTRKDILEELFRKEPERLKFIRENTMTGKDLCEEVNPSGSRVFKYKTAMLVMHGPEQGVTLRIFGEPDPKKMTWDDLLGDIKELFSEEDVDALISANATSHISQGKESEPVKPERAGKQEEKEEEIPKSRTEEESVQQETGEAPEEEDKEESEREAEETSVEEVPEEEVEVVEKKYDPVSRGYKAALSADIRMLQKAAEVEDWKRVKEVAESIRWRAQALQDREDESFIDGTNERYEKGEE